MTREQYITHPAISASRIKRFYTGDISHAQTALNKGKEFHYDLLERSFDDMAKQTQNVYNAIHEVRLLADFFDNAEKEYIHLANVTIGGFTVEAKAAMDLCNLKEGSIADVKTTSAKNLHDFGRDMVDHCNHVQEVWYSLVMGFYTANFYYIGVPPKVKKTGKFTDLYLYRHNAAEIESAKELIINYLKQL